MTSRSSRVRHPVAEHKQGPQVKDGDTVRVSDHAEREVKPERSAPPAREPHATRPTPGPRRAHAGDGTSAPLRFERRIGAPHPSAKIFVKPKPTPPRATAASALRRFTRRGTTPRFLQRPALSAARSARGQRQMASQVRQRPGATPNIDKRGASRPDLQGEIRGGVRNGYLRHVPRCKPTRPVVSIPFTREFRHVHVGVRYGDESRGPGSARLFDDGITRIW
jgi:hypothetical protein